MSLNISVKHRNSPTYTPIEVPILGHTAMCEYLSITKDMSENPSFCLTKFNPGFSWGKGRKCTITWKHLEFSGDGDDNLTLSFSDRGIYSGATGSGMVFIGLHTGQVVSWNGKEKKYSQSAHTSRILCLCFSSGLLVSACRNSVIVHDQNLNTLAKFSSHFVPTCVAISPSREYIVVGDSVGRLTFISTDTWTEFYSVLTRVQYMCALHVFPNHNIGVGDGENLDQLKVIEFQLPLFNYINILKMGLADSGSLLGIRKPLQDPRTFQKIFTYLA